MLTGCGMWKKTVVKKETEKQYPPATFVQHVDKPIPHGKETLRHVVLWAKQLETALDTANSRLQSIREWMDDNE